LKSRTILKERVLEVVITNTCVLHELYSNSQAKTCVKLSVHKSPLAWRQ